MTKLIMTTTKVCRFDIWNYKIQFWLLREALDFLGQVFNVIRKSQWLAFLVEILVVQCSSSNHRNIGHFVRRFNSTDKIEVDSFGKVFSRRVKERVVLLVSKDVARHIAGWNGAHNLVFRAILEELITNDWHVADMLVGRCLLLCYKGSVLQGIRRHSGGGERFTTRFLTHRGQSCGIWTITEFGQVIGGVVIIDVVYGDGLGCRWH